MNHENYSIEYDDWLSEVGQLARQPFRRKDFIGDRPYRHFDGRLAIQDLESNSAAKLVAELKYPKRLTRHAFFPFVRTDNKARRYTKEFDDKGKKQLVIKQKVRPIMYASHQDSVILGFYAWILKKKYDELAKKLDISDSVIAYRKIPRNDGSNRNKSNIDFANDIFNSLAKADRAAVICVDITDFFGSMLHTGIQATWAKTLGLKDLPANHAHVFRSVTRFRYIFQADAKLALGLGKIVKGKFVYDQKTPTKFRSGPLSPTAAMYNKYIKNSPFIKTNGSPNGIPQGSPISDIIANMYLMEFDQRVKALALHDEQGLYRRYSDDVLIICSTERAVEIYREVEKLMTEFGLKLSAKKSELFFIDRSKDLLVDKTALVVPDYLYNKSSIQYLGFEFDLEDIHIRSGTVAKHYRKLKGSMKKNAMRAEKRKKPNDGTPKQKRAKSDPYAYIKQVGKRITSGRLNKQFDTIRKRTSKFRREIGTKKR